MEREREKGGRLKDTHIQSVQSKETERENEEEQQQQKKKEKSEEKRGKPTTTH